MLWNSVMPIKEFFDFMYDLLHFSYLVFCFGRSGISFIHNLFSPIYTFSGLTYRPFQNFDSWCRRRSSIFLGSISIGALIKGLAGVPSLIGPTERTPPLESNIERYSRISLVNSWCAFKLGVGLSGKSNSPAIFLSFDSMVSSFIPKISLLRDPLRLCNLVFQFLIGGHCFMAIFAVTFGLVYVNDPEVH